LDKSEDEKMKLRPLIMCPYCDWQIIYGKANIKAFKEHLKECKTYKLEMRK